jgi:ATP-dependent DNA ligase
LTSFGLLQQRLGVRDPDPDLLRRVPVVYYVFDVLVADGRDVRALPSLSASLAQLELDKPPFNAGEFPRSRVHWVEPRLVAQIRFSEWTTAGQLRHPRYEGLRNDKDPAAVVREIPG